MWMASPPSLKKYTSGSWLCQSGLVRDHIFYALSVLSSVMRPLLWHHLCPTAQNHDAVSTAAQLEDLVDTGYGLFCSGEELATVPRIHCLVQDKVHRQAFREAPNAIAGIQKVHSLPFSGDQRAFGGRLIIRDIVRVRSQP